MLAKMSVERFQSRVARWFILKPKITILVHFGAPSKGKCFYIYDHLEYFMAIWHSWWSIVIFFPFWYVWTNKNLATLFQRIKIFRRCA
jgi:hypothetical protein